MRETAPLRYKEMEERLDKDPRLHKHVAWAGVLLLGLTDALLWEWSAKRSNKKSKGDEGAWGEGTPVTSEYIIWLDLLMRFLVSLPLMCIACGHS